MKWMVRAACGLLRRARGAGFFTGRKGGLRARPGQLAGFGAAAGQGRFLVV
jgi:hypothetical protein